NYLLAGVIWVIGWCMVLMAALVWLRPRTVGILGMGIIALHNPVMMPLITHTPPLAELWKILYIGSFTRPVAGTPLLVFYSLVPLLHRAPRRVAQSLTVFARVPFFYYVLHIPLIHALALVVSAIRLGAVTPWLFTNHPMANPPAPEGYTWSLGLLYLVWAIAI